MGTFESFIRSRLDAKGDSIVVPRLGGVDAGVTDIRHDKVLIIAGDPIFSVRVQTPEVFGWNTLRVGAIDVAAMIVNPRSRALLALFTEALGA